MLSRRSAPLGEWRTRTTEKGLRCRRVAQNRTLEYSRSSQQTRRWRMPSSASCSWRRPSAGSPTHHRFGYLDGEHRMSARCAQARPDTGTYRPRLRLSSPAAPRVERLSGLARRVVVSRRRRTLWITAGPNTGASDGIRTVCPCLSATRPPVEVRYGPENSGRVHAAPSGHPEVLEGRRKLGMVRGPVPRLAGRAVQVFAGSPGLPA
jgi:hypothetical protein